MKSYHFWVFLVIIILLYCIVFLKIKEKYFNSDTLLTLVGKNVITQTEDHTCHRIQQAMNSTSANDHVSVVRNMRLLSSKTEDSDTCYLKNTDSIMKDGVCSTENPNLFDKSYDSVVENIYAGDEKDPLMSTTIETPVCYVKFKTNADDHNLIKYAGFLSDNDPDVQDVKKSIKTQMASLYSQQDFDNNFTDGFDEGTVAGTVGTFTKQQYDDNYTSGYSKGVTAGRIGLYTPEQVQASKDRGKNEGISDIDNALKKTVENVGWQGGGKGQGGEVWQKPCGSPWNGYYKFSCEQNDKRSGWSDEVGPISHYNWQGPKIRVAPNGPNYCAQIGGNLKIARKRQSNQNWEDISNNVLNFEGNDKFNGKDAIFNDQYRMDC